MYQAFSEKIMSQIEYTRTSVAMHIQEKLIFPIDECLRLCRRGRGDVEHLNKFMELIVRQLNKLYCEWLEEIKGHKSILEYQQLSDKMREVLKEQEKEIEKRAKRKVVMVGDDIIEYYNQLTRLKSLVL